MRKPWTNKCFLGKIWKPWNDKCYLEFGNNELTYVIRGRMETMDWQMLFGKSGNNELTVVIRGRMKTMDWQILFRKIKKPLNESEWQMLFGKSGNNELTVELLLGKVWNLTVELLLGKVWKPWTDKSRNRGMTNVIFESLETMNWLMFLAVLRSRNYLFSAPTPALAPTIYCHLKLFK